MKEILVKLSSAAESEISKEDIQHAVTLIMNGQVSQAQLGAFLMGLKVYGEKPYMVAACADVMRSHSLKCLIDDVTDIVGTGGDGLNTFNVSTAAGVVAAAAGLRVAKHGNRASSSACGSADILEAAGANLDFGPADVNTIIDDCGFCFLFSQKFHPAMKHVAPARREVGLRTMFNIVGPLTNPAKPSTALIGVASHAIGRLVIDTLKLQEVKSAMVVCGNLGLDEISPEGTTKFWKLKDGIITEGELHPRDFDLPEYSIKSVSGGDPQHNLSILKDIVLKNVPGAYLDWVVMNAAALLFVNDRCNDFKHGVQIAKEAVSSGKAEWVLERFVQLSRSLVQEKANNS